MTAKIIDGKKIAQEIIRQASEEAKKINITPGIAFVSAGNNSASRIYIKNKDNACREAGFYTETHHLPEDTTQDEILTLIEKLNKKKDIHSILVQLPLPSHIDKAKIMNAISPYKDVDCFSPKNLGNLFLNDERIAPCTAKAVIKLIESTGTILQGRNVAIVGAGTLAGKPLSIMLVNRNATISICHEYTNNLRGHTKNADILISAVGKQNLIKKDMVKKDAVVIDVGISKGKDGRIVGDVDFNSVKEIASLITPVPGGVGPMTIACLLENAIECTKMQKTLC